MAVVKNALSVIARLGNMEKMAEAAARKAASTPLTAILPWPETDN